MDENLDANRDRNWNSTGTNARLGAREGWPFHISLTRFQTHTSFWHWPRFFKFIPADDWPRASSIAISCVRSIKISLLATCVTRAASIVLFSRRERIRFIFTLQGDIAIPRRLTTSAETQDWPTIGGSDRGLYLRDMNLHAKFLDENKLGAEKKHEFYSRLCAINLNFRLNAKKFYAR